MRRARLFNFRASSDVTLKIIFDDHDDIPELQMRVERSDMAFVLKVKIEMALRLLQYRDAALREVTAEEIVLQYGGVPLRDMTAVEKYGAKDGSELTAILITHKPERELIAKDPDYMYLDDIITPQG